MLGRWFRYVALNLVRIFYAPLEVANDGLEPTGQGTILVLNHPNGVMDPALIFAVTRRSVTFLAKSTAFAHSGKRWAMYQFGAIPIYRKVDIGQLGGARDPDDMQRRNEETFQRCRDFLADGGTVALFPEGLTHDQPQMARVRTGAARIALSTAASLGWKAPRLVPVGLWYENSTQFRTAAFVAPGKPVKLAAFQELYAKAPQEAVQQLTRLITERLHEVVLQAESVELLRSIPFVAALSIQSECKPNVKERQAKAAELLRGYRKIRSADPRRLAAIEQAVREYANELRSLGVSDPWKLEDPRPIAGYIVRRVLILAAWAVPALLGMIISYVPYRYSAHFVRHRLPYNRAQTGSTKVTVGTFMIAGVWVLEAGIVAALAGPWWGLALLATAPWCSYLALRWGEVGRKVHVVSRVGWLRRRRESVVRSLVEKRSKLASQIEAALLYVQALD